MRAMPFPEYISTESRNRLNVFYSICQICATSQVLFSYHLDEVFAGTAVNHLSPKLYSPHLIAYLSSICQLNLTHMLHHPTDTSSYPPSTPFHFSLFSSPLSSLLSLLPFIFSHVLILSFHLILQLCCRSRSQPC